MVEPQSSVHAGRAKILEPDEKIDGGEETLEDLMAKIEAIPSNVRLLKQIGVRESVKRVRILARQQPPSGAPTFLHARSAAVCCFFLSCACAHACMRKTEPRLCSLPDACKRYCSASVPRLDTWQNTRWRTRGYLP